MWINLYLINKYSPDKMPAIPTIVWNQPIIEIPPNIFDPQKYDIYFTILNLKDILIKL